VMIAGISILHTAGSPHLARDESDAIAERT
jgi:hypothetical protein